jgi:hypothetical protein
MPNTKSGPRDNDFIAVDDEVGHFRQRPDRVSASDNLQPEFSDIGSSIECGRPECISRPDFR